MKRYLCWEESLILKSSGVEVRQHEPQKKNPAFLADDDWEGVHNGYPQLIKVGDGYRMYYRAIFDARRLESETKTKENVAICVAESRDGITFKKPVIGKHVYNGSTFNNIVFTRPVLDNFAIFYDTCPSCPNEERFKALCETHLPEGKGTRLLYYASADGYDFKEMYPIMDVVGTFDSFNVCFWDEVTHEYRLYFRAFHSPDGTDKLQWTDNIHMTDDIRDVRLATSTDFKTWTTHGRIRFAEGQTDTPLYTNQILPYGRDTGVYMGFPMRYTDHTEHQSNFVHMPLYDRRRLIIDRFGREGTAVTDTLIMTSEDGITFNRRDESFLRPGIENRYNWWYGSAAVAHGLIETEGEEYGAPNELSLFATENYRIKNACFRRYTVRLDGFFSYYAHFSGGTLLTHPLPIEGDSLTVNFSSAACGGMTVTLCDENGNELDGYHSDLLIGDSTNRPVTFEKPLSALCGRSVSLKITLSDTHLYSFCLS